MYVICNKRFSRSRADISLSPLLLPVLYGGAFESPLAKSVARRGAALFREVDRLT
jgi:hypothetical protein